MKLEKKWVRLEQICFAGLLVFWLIAELVPTHDLGGLTAWTATAYRFYKTFVILGGLCLVGGLWIAWKRLRCPACGAWHMIILETGDIRCRGCGTRLKIQ